MDQISVRLKELPTLRVSLENIVVKNVETDNSHARLKDRDLADQHPISAITGLEDALQSAVSEEKIAEAVNDALALAKASGEFDGKDGKDGKDGVSASHSWNGTILTVTSSSGTSSVDLKGEKGDTGETGEQGPQGDKGDKGDPYTLTSADKSEIVRTVIESLGGNPVFGYVDANNNIIVQGNLADGLYNIKYEIVDEDGTVTETIDIGDLVLNTNVYYSVTNNLTNCTSDNSATQAVEGRSYYAVISANSGYELSSVVVTMGGTDITSFAVSGGTINISSVTGNIVITAMAAETAVGPSYINLADPTSTDWQEGYRLSISSGGTSELAGHTTTNFIPCKAGDVLRVKGMKIANGTATANSGSVKVVVYNTDKTKLGGLYGGSSGTADCYGNKVSTNGDISAYTIMYNNLDTQMASSGVAYIRVDGLLMEGYTANDVIITINEPIE